MREAVIDPFHRLTNLPTAGGSAAATSLVRDRERESFVEGGCKQRRFAVARMAEGGDSLGIDRFVGHEVIQGAMKSPPPGSDRAAVVRGRGRIQPSVNAVGNVGAI